MRTRSEGVLLLLLALPAFAHPRGVHERVTLTVTDTALTGLATLDIDSGSAARLIRAGADADHDGVLSKAEVAHLKDRLEAMAMRSLTLSVSSFGLTPTASDVKISTRGDARASDEGLSVAVLFEVVFPHSVSSGMSLSVTATAPDLSTVHVQVFHPSLHPPVEVDQPSGQPLEVRLESTAADAR